MKSTVQKPPIGSELGPKRKKSMGYISCDKKRAGRIVDDVPDLILKKKEKYSILGPWLLFFRLPAFWLAVQCCNWIVLAVSSLSILRSSEDSLVNARFRDRGGVKLREGSQWGTTVGTGPLSKDLRSVDWWLVGPTKPLHLCRTYSTIHTSTPYAT